MSIFINFLLVIHVVVSLLIVLIVLMQRPKSEGLGAAFGGGMTDNLFGAQTTNVLQKSTRVLGGIFFALTLLLSMLYSRQARSGNQSIIQQQLTNAPAVPAGTAPKTLNIDVPANSATNAEDLKKLIEQKLQEAKAAATPAPASSAAPATSPADKPKDDLESPKLQLQVPSGTAPGAEKPKESL